MTKAKASQSKPICKSLVVAIDDYPGQTNDLPIVGGQYDLQTGKFTIVA
jgi:hypothetical protein